MAKGLSQKEKDILKTILMLERKKDFRTSIFFSIITNILGFDNNRTTEKSAYRSLRRLEKRGLVKILRRKNLFYIKNISVTPKGIEALK